MNHARRHVGGMIKCVNGVFELNAKIGRTFLLRAKVICRLTVFRLVYNSTQNSWQQWPRDTAAIPPAWQNGVTVTQCI